MKKLSLITEWSQELQINELNEGKETSLYVTGIFSSHGRRNNNGRVYEEKTIKREVDKILEKVSKKCLWGELGHPPNPEINASQIALRVESLEWQGQDLYGKAKILNTPSGKIAQELVREGAIGISSRGLGTVGGDGTVNEDYNLITWDLVTDPSNSPSWMKGIYEGKTWSMNEAEEILRKMNEQEQTVYSKYITENIKKILKSL